jgi:hypothetical protein
MDMVVNADWTGTWTMDMDVGGNMDVDMEMDRSVVGSENYRIE